MTNPKDPQAELRDKINALRKQRDAHQMDEPDYVDAILALFQAREQQAVEADHTKAFAFGYNEAYEEWRKKTQQLLAELLGELPTGDTENWLTLEERPTDYIIGFETCHKQVVEILSRKIGELNG